MKNSKQDGTDYIVLHGFRNPEDGRWYKADSVVILTQEAAYWLQLGSQPKVKIKSASNAKTKATAKSKGE